MQRWLITGVCLAGVLAAVAMAWRWRDLERIDRTNTEPFTGRAGVRRVLRAVAVTVDSGILAGVLVLGLGGRLLMRILAATSDDAVQGRITDAEERVGEVTTGGTIGLVVFIGVFGGLMCAVGYRLVRRWLPARAWPAGLVAGVLLLGLAGRTTDLLDANNHDFEILSPAPLAVALAVALMLLFGVTLAAVHERLDRALPDLSTWSFGALSVAPVVATLLIPPVAAAIIIAVLFGALGGIRWPNSFTRPGQWAVALGVIVSVVVIATDATKIVA